MYRGEKNSKNKDLGGALLLEILIVVGVFAILAPIVAQIIVVSLAANKTAMETAAAAGLINETVEAVEGVAFSKWQNIYNLTKSPNNHYYPAKSAGAWTVSSGDELVSVNGRNYTRYFTVSNVCRDNVSRNIITTAGVPPCTAGNSDDPSTQKITITISWDGRIINKYAYLTRWRNQICNQTNWTAIGVGPATCPSTLYDSGTNIDISGTPGSLKIQAN